MIQETAVQLAVFRNLHITIWRRSTHTSTKRFGPPISIIFFIDSQTFLFLNDLKSFSSLHKARLYRRSGSYLDSNNFHRFYIIRD